MEEEGRGEEEEEGVEKCLRKGRFLDCRARVLEAYIVSFLWEKEQERREYRNLFFEGKEEKRKKKEKKKSHSAPPMLLYRCIVDER